MNRTFLFQKIAIAALCGGIACAGINACSAAPDTLIQPEFPRIIYQPEDQLVPLGSNATFKVIATNGPLSYQWLRNGKMIKNQTQNTLIIKNAGIKDVGFYSCDVYKKSKAQHPEAIPTRAASLLVYTRNKGRSGKSKAGASSFTVYADPVSSSGSESSCPGSYVGHASYTKSIQQGWGWDPDASNANTNFTASDTTRTNTKVYYWGMYGDAGCNQTTISIPNPPISPAYQFCIYFTNNVPTNAYPLTLDGFKP